MIYDLTDLTRDSDRLASMRFLQVRRQDRPAKRKSQGLESKFSARSFPIESYDKPVPAGVRRSYELGKPRYTPDRMSTAPSDLRPSPSTSGCGSTSEQPIEEQVYLGDMPIMIGGGEFIINGAERVVVSQLHRSPGVDFVSRAPSPVSERVYSCRIIPERGSWIELNGQRRRRSIDGPHRPEWQVRRSSTLPAGDEQGRSTIGRRVGLKALPRRHDRRRSSKRTSTRRRSSTGKCRRRPHRLSGRQ